MSISESTSTRSGRQTVSAVIPAYNGGPFIREALCSVFEQTRVPDEIIVVNDCSTDNTVEIVRSFADKRLRLVSTAKNSGSAVARNIGIHEASGDLIAFLDADDIWLPQHCATVAPLLEQHAAAALAFSRTEAFGDDSWTWRPYIHADEPVWCFWNCLQFTIVPQMNVVARRTTLLEIGGYRPELRQAQDFDLCLRLAFKHRFICSHQVTTRYRRHPGSITASNPFRALSSEYTARYLFWKENHASMEPADCQRLEETLRDIWLEHVRSAWHLNDFDALCFHLKQHELVPGSAALYRAWMKKRRFFSLKKAWASCPAPVRAALNTALRPLFS